MHVKRSFISIAAFSFMVLSAFSTVLVVKPIDRRGNDIAVEFYAPDRGILDSITFHIPESWGRDCLEDVKVNVIGRGYVPVMQLSEQSIGRQGSLSPRINVGDGEVITSLDNGCFKIKLTHLDIRPDNGADIRLLLKGVKNVGEVLTATWSMSTPVIPDSLQGELYKVHDANKRYSVTSRYEKFRPVSRKHYDATTLGLKGDGVSDNTDALNAAIHRLNAEGGGIIDFKDGIYNLRTVRLLSHVWLHVCESATLRAIPGLDEHEPTWFADYNHEAGFGSFDESVYDSFGCYMVKQDVGHSFFRNAMFYAMRQEDIRIFGSGRITGDGIIDSGNGVMKQRDGYRADKMMAFKLCKDIEVGGEDCPSDMWYDEALDSPAYLDAAGNLEVKSVEKMLDVDQGGHFVILATGCDGVRIHDINCCRLSINRARDMFDLMACNDVEVFNIYCRHCGDDIVKLGSDCSLGFTRPCGNISVRNIVGDTNCNLFQIGSETADDITDVWVDNIYVLGANKAGFSISSNDGGTVARVRLNSGKTGPLHHRSIMKRTRTPIFLSISNRGRVIGADVGRYVYQENGKIRNELLVKNVNIGRVEDIDLRHFDSSEIYAGSDGSKDRWRPYDGRQSESTPIIAGFKLPDNDKVEGGLDFTLPDGRSTGYIENVTLVDINFTAKGGHPAEHSLLKCPEIGLGHFNIRDLKIQPSYGLWARHVRNLCLEDVSFNVEMPDGRPAVIFDDVR